MELMPLPALPRWKPDRATALGCVLDTETTGISTRDEAVEVGVVLFGYRRATGEILGIVDEYVGLREPTVPMHPEAQRVHGISPQELQGKRLDYNHLESILIRAEFIIAHNANFDYRYMSKLSDTAAEKPWLCSMRGIDWRGKGFGSKGLQELLAAHRIRVPQAHRALADVYGVLYLLACREGDRTYLSELLERAAAE